MAALPEFIGTDTELSMAEKPTNTFIIDWSSAQISGMDDGLAAMRQAVEIILQSERFRWQIYDSNFGSEFEDLPGEEYDYIVGEIPRRVREAFSVDKRILDADHFSFSRSGDIMHVSFDVTTVFGVLREEVEI